jgi:hypothetical protein
MKNFDEPGRKNYLGGSEYLKVTKNVQLKFFHVFQSVVTAISSRICVKKIGSPSIRFELCFVVNK